MKNTAVLVKLTLLRQMRSRSFCFTSMVSILLGFLCVPGMADGYQIFYLGGVRGVYNSAWLGAIAAILPTILLWLPGFYLLRSQISEDRRLKIGQTVASAPISKLQYIGEKFLCNFAVLFSFASIFVVAVLFMQLFRREWMVVEPMKYLLPLLLITVPYLVFLAALTVFMDVVPLLKGTFGNIVVFFIWVTLSSVSVAAPGNSFDVFGIGYVLGQMLGGAQAVYPGLPEAASFGYYPNNGTIPTFQWSGMVWEQSFLLNRVLWIGISLCLVAMAVLVFDRFRTPHSSRGVESKKAPSLIPRHTHTLQLPPVLKSSRTGFSSLLCGELRLMLGDKPLWWYGAVLTAVVCSYFVVISDGLRWISLIMLLPIGVWSQMGCREKLYNTSALIASSCAKMEKWLACWSAGVLVSFFFSSGLLLRFATDGQWQHFAAWAAGALFIPTVAMLCGTLAGGTAMFEGVYIVLLYFGPINNMWRLDFLGVQSNQATLYLVLTAVLMLLNLLIILVSEKGNIKNLMRGRG